LNLIFSLFKRFSGVHFLSFWTQKEEKTEPKERKTVNLARATGQGFRP
jgi:hypothetical protein